MPGGDRTGPAGMGPMTGRGAGFCAGFGAPGFVNRGVGFFGRGRGGGGGWGWRNTFYATGLTGWQRAAMGTATPWAATAAPQPQAERQLLQTQLDILQSQLEEIKKRLTEIEAQT